MTTGWDVRWVPETGSTNADLLVAGTAGAPDRTVLGADHQTAGRGRLDRRWDAPAGVNLLASLLLREVPAHPHELTQRVALAALRACATTADVTATLKWPNDLLVGQAKLAGVLAQSGTSPAGAFVVVGIGLNIGWAPPGAAQLGAVVTPRALLDAMLAAYDGLPADIAGLYRRHLSTIGSDVRVELAGQQFLEGRAVDVEADGRLVVVSGDAVTHRIDSGDVVHLRPG